MYVAVQKGYGQLDDYGEVPPVAPMVAATQTQSAGQAVGLVFAFLSTLMFFTSIVAQGDR